jgi:hypothetical protein
MYAHRVLVHQLHRSSFEQIGSQTKYLVSRPAPDIDSPFPPESRVE